MQVFVVNATIEFFINAVLKIMAGQQSLTIATTFLTAKKLSQAVNMTANT